MPRLPTLTRQVLALGLCAGLLTLAAPAAPGGPGVAVDPLVPADASFVVSANVKQILAAPLVKKHALPALTAALARGGPVAKVLQAAGLDPLRDVESVTITGVGELDKSRWFAVVRGRFDTDKILAVAAEHAKQHADQIEVIKDGERSLVEFKDKSHSACAGFADNRTLVLSPDKVATVAVIARAGKAPARLNKELQAALDDLPSRDAVYAAAVIGDETKKAIRGKQGVDPGWIDPVTMLTAGIEVGEAAHLAVAIHTRDEDSAAALRKKIDDVRPLLNLLAGPEGNGPVVKEVLETIKVDNAKAAVTITLSVTEEALKKAAVAPGKPAIIKPKGSPPAEKP